MEYWLFLRVVSRRKWLIIGIIVLTMIATYAGINLTHVPVDARTSILFNYRTPRDVDVFDDRSVYTTQNEQTEHYNFVAMFNSTSVLEEAYALAKSRIDLGNIDVKQLKKKSKATLQMVRVGGKDEQTSMTEFVVTLRDEARAIELCKAVSEVAIKRYKDLLTDAVVKSREYLEMQVKDAKVELDDSQTVLEKFYTDNPEFTKYLDRTTFSGETMRSESSQVDMEVSLASLNTQIQAVKSDIDKYSKDPVDQMPVSLQSSAMVNEKRSQLMVLILDRDKLLQRYSPEYPRVKKLDSEIAETRKNLYGTYVDLLKENLASLEAKKGVTLSSMTSMDSFQTKTTYEYNDFSVKRLMYDGLVRDLNVAETNYRLMREKLAEAKIREDEAKNRYNLYIIDAPDRAFEKEEFFYKPNFKLLFAFFASFIFAFVLVFLMDYFEFRFKTTTDISRIIGLPILGEIPEYKSGK
jgi:uncharacterized protein involved in exopolysaccharide biosynthesis